MPAKKTELTISNIDDASTSDILKFGKDECGLDFEEGSSRAYMLELIFQTMGWQRDDFEENVTHVKIKIATDNSVGGTSPVRVGGRWTIQRDKEVIVPVACYNIMADINEQATTVAPIQNGNLEHETPIDHIMSVTPFPISVKATYANNKTD